MSSAMFRTGQRGPHLVLAGAVMVTPATEQWALLDFAFRSNDNALYNIKLTKKTIYHKTVDVVTSL